MIEQRILIPSQCTLQIITLWQPWASWVLWGWKTIETRTHDRFRSLQGKRIGIHAARCWDGHAIDAAASFLTDEQLKKTHAEAYRTVDGSLICTAFVSVCCPVGPSDAHCALIECDTPRFGLFLKDVAAISPPIPLRGRQGIWRAIIPC